MIAPGLCSITFRTRAADEVLDIAVRSGVEGIEWGADAHVAPGDVATAERVAARCRDAGVEVVSYGSYLGFTPSDGDDAAKTGAVLDSAEALGAPMVRIWTELGVSPDAAPDDRRRVADRTAGFADAVAARGLVAALEFHPYTLTETATSTNHLLDDLARPNLRSHWQPDPSLAAPDAVEELAAVTGRLAHLHAFSWGPNGIADRRPLADGAAVWKAALALADRDGAPLPGHRRYALCEYVRGDDPDQLVADVRTLRRWLGSLGGSPGGSPGAFGWGAW